MNTELMTQLRLFLGSMLLGVLLGVLYDLFRVARRGMGRWLGWMWDGVYLLLALLTLFALSLQFGAAGRGVTALLAAAGGGAYAVTLSPPIRAGLAKVCAWLALPLRLVEKPLKNTEKIAKKLFAKLQNWFTITKDTRNSRQAMPLSGEEEADAGAEDHLEITAVAGGGVRVCYAAERVGRHPHEPLGADTAAGVLVPPPARERRAAVYYDRAERGKTESTGT